MNMYFSTGIIYFIIIKIYVIIVKKLKSAYSYFSNYILNDILSNFIINKKVKYKNVVRGKNDIYPPVLTL
jgi:hypothetical protein